MVVKKKGNEDDYYSSIVPEKQEQSSDGKKVPKIKIKSVIHKGASSEDKKAPNLVEPVVSKGGEEEKEGTKKRVKSKQQTPIVTFEKAPEIQKSKEPPKQTISPFEKTIKKEALPIKEKNDSSVTLPPSQ
jgi:hypothetical protein